MEHDYHDENSHGYATSVIADAGDHAIDDFVHKREEVLEKKLSILRVEMLVRLLIRDSNITRLGEDEENALQALRILDERARYNLRDHKDKSAFYEHIFKLHQERRSEDVEAWRDVVNVMRDFLEAWEAHENAKARGKFLRGA